MTDKENFGKDINVLTKAKLIEQLISKTQECEGLKKQLEFVRTHRTVIDAEKDRYRKALEEIEEYIKEEEWSLLDYVIRDILNIINKAKGEGKCNMKI